MRKFWIITLGILVAAIGLFWGGFYSGRASGIREVAELKRNHEIELARAEFVAGAAIDEYRLALDAISDRSGTMADRLRILADTSTVAGGTLAERLRIIIERFKGVQVIVTEIRSINEQANRALEYGNTGEPSGN